MTSLDPNVLIALSLLIAHEAKTQNVAVSFTNPGGNWSYGKADTYRRAWGTADAADCEKRCFIWIDGFWCSICGQPQALSYGGLTCSNGHGGAETVYNPPKAAPPRKHEWVDNPRDLAGYQCRACGCTDLDEAAKQPCCGLAE